MSQQHLFEVEPVRSYDGARYFAAPLSEGKDEREDKPHPLAVVVMFLLVFGLSIGLIGCYMRTEYEPGEPPQPQPDADPPDPPEPPDCEDGQMRCADELTLQVCNEGEWETQTCEDLCHERAPEDEIGYSMGCDAEAEDPCQCFFDMIDGDAVSCFPDELYCDDEQTVVLCELGEWAPRDCDEYCVEQHGPGWVSEGCDASNPEDPCGCVEDVLDGVAPSCTPGDVYCADDTHAVFCQDDGLEVAVECDAYCQEQGLDSHGCDATDPDNPCGCFAPGEDS